MTKYSIAGSAAAAIAVWVPLVLLLNTATPGLFVAGLGIESPTANFLASTGPVWPGTYVSLHEQEDVVVVEREWLGLSEARQLVERTDSGWRLASEISVDGPANLAQSLILLAGSSLLSFGIALMLVRFRAGFGGEPEGRK